MEKDPALLDPLDRWRLNNFPILYGFYNIDLYKKSRKLII
jgi:hypothetical protein